MYFCDLITFCYALVGQQLISVRGACPREVVQPKCDELSRVCDIVTERLSRRLEILLKSRDLMERVEKVCYYSFEVPKEEQIILFLLTTLVFNIRDL